MLSSVNDLRRLKASAKAIDGLEKRLDAEREQRDWIIVQMALRNPFPRGRRPKGSKTPTQGEVAKAAGLSDVRVRELIAEAEKRRNDANDGNSASAPTSP